MISIGIDQSLSSTGVVVSTPDSIEFYLISNKPNTKYHRWAKDNISPLRLYTVPSSKKIDMSYRERERDKYDSIKTICNTVKEIFEDIHSRFPFDKVYVYMEGVSFASHLTSSIVELAGLNFILRDLIICMGWDFIIVPPTKLKKFATGNGSADKDLMTNAFVMLNPRFKEVKDIPLKVDDIADAYFLSCMGSASIE